METLKINTPARHIGFFQFYDVSKGYGFLGTNKLLTGEDECDGSELMGVYVNFNQINVKLMHNNAMYPPFYENDWVTFEIKQTSNNNEAIHLCPAHTSDGLKIAFTTYWRQPRIEGWDPKHKNHYDKHIIYEVLQSFLKRNDSASEKLFKIFCKCLSNISDKKNYISAIFDDKISPLMYECFFNLPHGFKHEKLSNFDIVVEKIIEHFISEDKWGNIIDAWSKGFINESHYKVIRNKLIDGYRDEANIFLSKLSVSEIKDILCGANLTSVSWGLAQSLYKNVNGEFHTIFQDSDKYSDPLLFFLYLSGQHKYIYYINDWQNIFDKLDKCNEYIGEFIDIYASVAAEETVIEKLVQKDNIRSYAINKILSFNRQQDRRIKFTSFFTRFILNAEIIKNNYDWELLASYLEHDISIEFWYPEIRKKFSESYQIQGVKHFFQALKLTDAQNLFSNVVLQTINWDLAKILHKQYGDLISEIFVQQEGIPDHILLLLYLCGRSDCIQHISNWEDLLKNLESQYSHAFAQRLMKDDSPAAKHVLLIMTPDILATILCSLEGAELFNTLCKLADMGEIIEKLTFSAAVLLPDSTPVEDFRRQRWDTIRAKLPYTAFDLESDGKHIREFAFLQDGELRRYEGEYQLSSLLRRLNNVEIIVGHNIRQWDLPILEKCGLTTSAFVWDTLEIELLLNPCRYAYSLLAQHKADKDTELANDLFWNQLYRLAHHPELCKELENFLPNDIEDLLTRLNTSPYDDFFKGFAQRRTNFFKDRISLSRKTKIELSKLKCIASKGRVLLIAPRSLWSELALFLPLSFPVLRETEMKEYRMISRNNVEMFPPETSLGKAFLLRFCKECSTPILANIPQYIRANAGDSKKLTLDDLILERYAVVCNGSIDCVDMDAFNDASLLLNKYTYIATIQSEVQDRLHKVKISEDMTFDEIMKLGGCYPFKMNMSGCASVEKEDFKRIFASHLCCTDGPYDECIANIWIERHKNKMFGLYINYFFEEVLKKLSSHYNVSNVLHITWERSLPTSVRSPVITLCKKMRNFDSAEFRVNSDSPYRGKYWAAQIAFLREIRMMHSQEIPIVFVVDALEADERDSLQHYLEHQKLTVDRKWKSLKDLDLAFKEKNAVLVVNKNDFAKDISTFRSDSSFCVVWDNIGTERLRVMWRNLPFTAKAFSHDIDEIDARRHHTTISQCIEVAWPLLVHYSAMLSVNNTANSFYVIEPAFDTYPAMGKQLSIQSDNFLSLALWKNEVDWEKSYAAAQKYFSTYPSGYKDASIDLAEKHNLNHAKDTIHAMIIGGNYEQVTGKNNKTTFFEKLLNGKGDQGTDNNKWRLGQEQILDSMLQKKGNYIVSMPTGGGKSVLFQGPALYRGYFSKKLSIVITPLRSLMEDQVVALDDKGFGACVDYINSDRSYAEVCQIYRRIRSGSVILLYITPERFRVRSFMKILNTRMEHDGGLEYVIFDEAHCIAQWGNDFRPDYYNAYRKCAELGKKYAMTIGLFSATITAQEEDEYKRILPGISLIGQKSENYNPVRKHIEMQFELVDHDSEARLGKVIQYIRNWNIKEDKSKMIVFCRKREDCELFSTNLDTYCRFCDEDDPLRRYAGHIGFFHAGMEQLEREDTYGRFNPTRKVDNPLNVLFATKAFGMGMDIPNIHYLMHTSPPSILEDYLQEVGRAGRDKKMYEEAFGMHASEGKLPPIPAVCLISNEDFKNLKTLLQSSLLAWSNLSDALQKVVAKLEQHRTLDQCKKEAVIVPWDIWLKDPQRPDDTTASRLVLHWLERAGRIRLGYLMPSHLDITLAENNVSDTLVGSLRGMFHLLLEYSEIKGKMTQIPLQELRQKLHIPIDTVMDLFLELENKNVLTLHNIIYCDLTNRRHGETQYAVKYNDNRYFALHIYIEILCYILNECSMEHVYDVDQEQRDRYIELLMGACDYKPNELVKKSNKRGNKDVIIDYMPWEDKLDNIPKYSIKIFESFKHDIARSGVRRMMLILAYTPGIKFRDNRNIQHFRIETDEWRDFLPSLEEDCVELLRCICEKEPAIGFNWSNFARKAGLLEKGYGHFFTVLTILRRLGYITQSPLLPNGIEIFTTEKTNEVLDTGTDPNSTLYSLRRDFDEQEQVKKARLACMNIFTHIKHNVDRNNFIKYYFQCANKESYLKLLDLYAPRTNLDEDRQKQIIIELNDEALKNEEANLNREQRDIYECSVHEHINVLAGPGSGKTHVLTLRCAKLIYTEKVDPSQVLVLAYNRAVVVELRNRLDNLFANLGLSRFASRIPVFTFHGLVKRCLAEALKDVNTDQWDEEFLEYLKNNRNKFKSKFSQIKHVLVDEFQDITKIRLEYLKELHLIFPDAKFFTIGDINQSIYGFDRIPNSINLDPIEYARLLDPSLYYDEWNSLLSPKQMTMFINYRSYPKILDLSARYLPETSVIPYPSEFLVQHEPKSPYVFNESITEKDLASQPWLSTIRETISWAKNENASGEDLRCIRTIAVFFRTNSEVYQAYSHLCDLQEEGVRLRIQGQSICELWRKREFFEALNWLITVKGDDIIELHDDSKENRYKTYVDIINCINSVANKYKNRWDIYYMNVLNALIRYYVDSIKSDDIKHTFREMAEYIMELCDKDDSGQIYKIYDKYYSGDETISVVLTTMHKVKGLEFDSVIIAPSVANLPIKRHTQNSELTTADYADLNEEKRLMFVACTRAKKRLHVFIGPREQALMDGTTYNTSNYYTNYIYEKEQKLEQYFLSINSWNKNYDNYGKDIINVCAREPVCIKKHIINNRTYYFIESKGRVIRGALSNKSNIVRAMNNSRLSELSGFFVSDVIAWRFKDSKDYDSKHGTNFSNLWGDKARNKGFVYITIISGMGKP